MNNILKFIKNDAYELFMGKDELKAIFEFSLNRAFLRLGSESIMDLFGINPIMDWTIVGQIYNDSKYKRETSVKTPISDVLSTYEILNTALNNQIFESKPDYRFIKIAPIAIYIQ